MRRHTQHLAPYAFIRMSRRWAPLTVTGGQHIAAMFYRHCGNAGVLRPEVFSTTARPDQFVYIRAPHVHYGLSGAMLQIHGEMRLVLRETVPLWVLLHLDGPAGELMSWLNLRRLNPETCEIIPSVVFRIAADTSYQQYHVRLYGVDISKYAFVLRRYLRRAWTAFEQDAGKESDAPLFSDSTSTAPLDRSPSRYLGHRM